MIVRTTNLSYDATSQRTGFNGNRLYGMKLSTNKAVAEKNTCTQKVLQSYGRTTENGEAEKEMNENGNRGDCRGTTDGAGYGSNVDQ